MTLETSWNIKDRVTNLTIQKNKIFKFDLIQISICSGNIIFDKD